MKVYISTMKKKPEHCADCPLCDSYDDCVLLPKYYKTWDAQYKDCKLVEEDE